MTPRDELPHSEEAEKALLGSMILGGPATIENVRAQFGEAAAFYTPRNQIIFTYLLAAQASGMPVDLVTFTQALTDAGEIVSIGGAVYLTELFTFVPSAANVAHYLDIVREKWLLRSLIEECRETERRAYEENETPDLLLNDHVSNVIELGQSTTVVESIKHLKEFVPRAVEEIEATYYNRGEPIGLASGIHAIDRMTGGFQAPLAYYIAARPAMGKSSGMLEIADHLAIEQLEKGCAVGIFSTEMTGVHLAQQLICSRGSVNLQRLRDGMGDEEMLPKVRRVADELVRSKVWIDEKAALSIFEFRARARRMVVKMGVKLIMIDYIQRMHSTSKRAQGNREQEMNEIAMGISATAKELNVPVIVLAQLNRKADDRPDKRPSLSDLRESGSMEQEARCVILLYRPSYYAPPDDLAKRKKMARNVGIEVPEDDDEAGEPTAAWRLEFEQYAEWIVAKQNKGPVGTVKVRFVKEYARFENWNPDEKFVSNNPALRQGGGGKKPDDQEDF